MPAHPLDGTTICALSTPPGRGGVAVVRVSGPAAWAVVDDLCRGQLDGATPGRAALRQLMDGDRPLDEALILPFRGPKSFTGEDVVECHIHGSPFIVKRLMECLIDAGCRSALPGEFTQRAFLHGKRDLAQAEAIGDLIDADHAGAHRLAMNQLRGDFARAIGELREGLIGFAGLLELELDFAEEDVEFADRSQFDALLGDLLSKVGSLADSFRTGNAIREGIPVAIIGAPNRGKSTLLNALLGDERAIVSATAGTTRDTIEDTCIIGGKKFRFIDTAGIRETTDEIESEGIRRALDKAQGASIVLYLFDTSVDGAEAVDQALEAAAIGPEAQTAIVWNKTDLAAAPGNRRDLEFHVSAAQGLGVEELKGWLAEWGSESHASDALMVTNFRHYEALIEARTALEATRSGLHNGIPGDLVASDVRQALHHLGSITGEIDP